MAGDISYIEKNGKYLIFKEDGTSELLKTKKEFDKHVKTNKLKIVK